MQSESVNEFKLYNRITTAKTEIYDHLDAIVKLMNDLKRDGIEVSFNIDKDMDEWSFVQRLQITRRY